MWVLVFGKRETRERNKYPYTSSALGNFGTDMGVLVPWRDGLEGFGTGMGILVALRHGLEGKVEIKWDLSERSQIE